MSIRGDVPIPCFNPGFCKRAGSGKTQCNPQAKHCENPFYPYSIKNDPFACCGRIFRYPSQGTFGSRADLSPPEQRGDPLTIDPLTWEETAKSMWQAITNWSGVTVPSETSPTFWQKFEYVFLSSQKRAIISAIPIILLALLIAIL